MIDLTPTAAGKMSAARARVLDMAPYFADIVHGFTFVGMDEISTMLCTPKMVLGYGTKWAQRADILALAADIVHAVYHIASHHFERGEKVENPNLFNVAADLTINPMLAKAGWKLLNGVFPDDYGLPDGMTAEWYYAELLKQQKHGKQPKKGKGSGSGEQGSGGGQGEPGDSDPQTSGAAGKPEKPHVCKGRCGSAGGDRSQKEIEDKLNSIPDTGRTPAEIRAIEKNTATAIKAHAEQHGRGSVPGFLLDQAEAFTETSKIRWQDELSCVLRDATGQVQAGASDFSMRRPSKRSIMTGLVRPGMIEQLPEIAIVRDTSGSMGSKQLTDAVKEAYFILQLLGIDEVWYVDADTQIQGRWKRVNSAFFKSLTEAKGRGGTDFRPAIDSAMKLHPRPDMIVYLTDADGTAADFPPPGAAVVWAVIPSYFNKAPAPWGKTIIIADKEG